MTGGRRDDSGRRPEGDDDNTNNEKEKERAHSLHDMGGDMGAADNPGANAPPDVDVETDTEAGTYARPSPIGKAGTPNVAGTDEQQPELASKPVPGTQPDEEPPKPKEGPEYLDIDENQDTLGRGAEGSRQARLRQKREGGP